MFPAMIYVIIPSLNGIWINLFPNLFYYKNWLDHMDSGLYLSQKCTDYFCSRWPEEYLPHALLMSDYYGLACCCHPVANRNDARPTVLFKTLFWFIHSFHNIWWWRGQVYLIIWSWDIAYKSTVSFLKKISFIYFYRGKGKEKKRERNINVGLSLKCPLLETWPATQGCALNGNWSGNPMVCRAVLNPLSHTRQGSMVDFTCFQRSKFSENWEIFFYQCTKADSVAAPNLNGHKAMYIFVVIFLLLYHIHLCHSRGIHVWWEDAVLDPSRDAV